MEPPPQLSPLAIAEFKAIYLAEFGEELSEPETEAVALRLLQLLDLLTQTT